MLPYDTCLAVRLQQVTETIVYTIALHELRAGPSQIPRRKVRDLFVIDFSVL